MPSAPGGPRLLLRRLREIMAEPVGAQDRLDKIVTQIAANMVAEVCSVYVMRGDGVLELFATEGLNREAVHLTIMRSGEGLVGLIAATAEPSPSPTPRAIRPSPTSPRRAKRSTTPSSACRCCAPATPSASWSSRTAPIASMPRKRSRRFQTTAMVVAEMLATGELQALAPVETGIALRRPVYQKGVALADGVGLGHVVLHEPRVVVKNLIAENIESELQRLDAAIAEVRLSIDELIERGDVAHHGEHREVLETFRMFAHDQGWLRRMREAVTSGLTAEAAVERVQSDNRARMLRQTDPYLRERLHDLDDLANRLLHRLVGRDLVAERGQLPENAILVARSMGPAALLDYDRSRLRGPCSEEGGPTSHIAIVARALGIPAVGEVSNATSLTEPGDAIIVDGAAGEVQIGQSRRGGGLRRKGAPSARRQEQYLKLRDVPSVAGRGRDHPATQCRSPSRPAASGGDRGCRCRPVPHRASIHDRRAHALGLRAAGALQHRLYGSRRQARHLPHPRYRRRQDPALHAIRRGGEPGPRLARHPHRARPPGPAARPSAPFSRPPPDALSRSCSRWWRPATSSSAPNLLWSGKAHLANHSHPLPSDLKLGVMLEVPSLLFQLKEICESADFISLGTNDLMQFLLPATARTGAWRTASIP